MRRVDSGDGWVSRAGFGGSKLELTLRPCNDDDKFGNMVEWERGGWSEGGCNTLHLGIQLGFQFP